MFDVRDALNKVKQSFSHEEPPSRGSSRSSNLSSRKSTRSKNLALEETNIYDDDELLPVSLNGYAPSTKNKLLTPEMCDEIRTLMPTRIQLYTEWNLLYSLEQHGASLRSLYQNVAPLSKSPARVGYVIVIRDRKHGTFGAYANEPFHPTESRRYYGNGECFLWKLEKVPDVSIGEGYEYEQHLQKESQYRWQFRGYPYTGLNEFAIYCQSNFLSMGAGDGHYGLWLDDSLIHGVSNPSQTYGNDVLSREGKKFHIVALEVWRVG